LLGYKKDDSDPDRSKATFLESRKRHLELEQQINSKAYSAVCRFFENWSPEKASQFAEQLNPIISSFGVFRLASERTFVHQDEAVVSYWERTLQSVSSAPRRMHCLVTGIEGPVAILHEPKIKGVRSSSPPPGGGHLLVSFNDKAYESLSKEQGENAPVSEVAAFKYTNALNYLLGPANRQLQLGDATVVFWAGTFTPVESFISDIFGDAPPPPDNAPAEDKERAAQVRTFLSQLRDGYANSTALREDEQTPFYILGLSPNASRLSVRFWLDTTLGELKLRLAQHLQDTALAGQREGDAPPVIRRFVNATGRGKSRDGRFEGYDTDMVSPLLAGALARAVLTGGPYPASLLTAMLSRLRTDGQVRHERIAAIKACLVRNSRFAHQPKEIPVALDTNRTDPAYVSGRLFALLEKIQTDSAEGDLNKTIKDRYFSAASATPALVFPRLIRLSQHHLAKMDVGQKVYYEKQLGEVVGKLSSFAPHLSLEDQGLFAIGYFHQRQDLFTAKPKPELQPA
jgi:CRISPR-associated protein Csd1